MSAESEHRRNVSIGELYDRHQEYMRFLKENHPDTYAQVLAQSNLITMNLEDVLDFNNINDVCSFLTGASWFMGAASSRSIEHARPMMGEGAYGIVISHMCAEMAILVEGFAAHIPMVRRGN